MHDLRINKMQLVKSAAGKAIVKKRVRIRPVQRDKMFEDIDDIVFDSAVLAGVERAQVNGYFHACLQSSESSLSAVASPTRAEPLLRRLALSLVAASSRSASG